MADNPEVVKALVELRTEVCDKWSGCEGSLRHVFETVTAAHIARYSPSPSKPRTLREGVLAWKRYLGRVPGVEYQHIYDHLGELLALPDTAEPEECKKPICEYVFCRRPCPVDCEKLWPHLCHDAACAKRHRRAGLL